MAGRGDPRKASDMVRRSASPPAAWGGGERRVVALKPMGPSIIIGFPEVNPSAGEQANPRHGFVSRPGGAFKFQAVRQMPTQAPKNQYQVPGSRVYLRTHARSAVRGLSAVASHDCSLAQELRTLTHSSSGSTRHTSSSHAATQSLSVSGVRGDRSRAGTSQDVERPHRAGSSDVEVRLDATLVLVERSESQGCGKPVCENLGRLLTHIPRPVLSQAQITALKDLHKSLASAEESQRDLQDESPDDMQGQMPGRVLDTSNPGVHDQVLRDWERVQENNRPGQHQSVSMHIDQMHSHADGRRPPQTPSLDIQRPSTSMGFSTLSEDAATARGQERSGIPSFTSTKYEDILPSCIGRRSASRTPGLMWVSAPAPRK